jgi:hypothetical protein
METVAALTVVGRIIGLADIGASRDTKQPSNESEALDRGAIAAEIRVTTFRRLGPWANPFVRAAQSCRSFVGRSIARLFPPREAGLLMGLALGDDSRLDPALARDFLATGPGHLLVVSGDNGAHVPSPDGWNASPHHGRTEVQSHGQQFPGWARYPETPGGSRGLPCSSGSGPGSTSIEGNPLVMLPIGINAPFRQSSR